MGFAPAVLQEKRHRFAAALQSALTLDEVEKTYISAAEGVIPTDSSGLYRLCAETGSVLAVRVQLSGPDFLSDYESYGRADDPVLDLALQHRRPIDSSRAVTAERWEASGARSALGVGGYAHSMEAPFVVSGLVFGTINFAREGQHPVFDEDDLVSARLISEQLGLATERALRFEMTGGRASMFEGVLDRVPQALVVTDLDARVLYRNRAARNEPSVETSLQTHADGKHPVGESIAEAMEEFRVHGKRTHTRSVRAADRQLIVRSYRLSEQHDAAVTLIFNCAEPEGPRKLPAWEVLSRREQEIAELVSQGLTTKQIADQAFISENTVKQHLKRVFAKTDVHNRAELVQLIWASGRPGPGPAADD